MIRRMTNAALVGLGVALLVVILMRTVSHLPLIAGITGFFVAWAVMVPSRRSQKKPKIELPAEDEMAVLELDLAAMRLRDLSDAAPTPDRPLFRRLSELMAQIHDRHRRNPDHVRMTTKFRRHVVGRMVDAVATYVLLAQEAGEDQKDRLAAISSDLEAFVPVLERIDKACLENDLTALEINVEVLNEQLNRRPRG